MALPLELPVKAAPRDRRTLLVICAVDLAVVLGLLLLAWATPYAVHLSHLALVGTWWIGAVMAYGWERWGRGAGGPTLEP